MQRRGGGRGGAATSRSGSRWRRGGVGGGGNLWRLQCRGGRAGGGRGASNFHDACDGRQRRMVDIEFILVNAKTLFEFEHKRDGLRMS